jgi:hypothetical protein
MLADSKDGFPKFLYLDQNKWIDLAKAYYRKPDGERFRDALAAVQEAVVSGKLVVPYSLVNAIETTVSKDQGRRDRLSNFLVRLSHGNAVLPFTVTDGWEMTNALRSLLNRGTPIHIRHSLISPGIDHAFGRRLRVEAPTPELEATIMSGLISPRKTLRALRRSGDNQEWKEQKEAVEKEAVTMFERIRAWASSALSRRQLRSFMLAELLTKGHEGQGFRAALKDANVTQAEFRTLFATAEDQDRFLDRVPALDVHLTLAAKRDQNPDQKIKDTDMRDLAWLAVALPYANLVVSEKNWAHLVKASRLRERYGTTIITDVCELSQRLLELGCL